MLRLFTPSCFFFELRLPKVFRTKLSEVVVFLFFRMKYERKKKWKSTWIMQYWFWYERNSKAGAEKKNCLFRVEVGNSLDSFFSSLSSYNFVYCSTHSMRILNGIPFYEILFAFSFYVIRKCYRPSSVQVMRNECFFGYVCWSSDGTVPKLSS